MVISSKSSVSDFARKKIHRKIPIKACSKTVETHYFRMGLRFYVRHLTTTLPYLHWFTRNRRTLQSEKKQPSIYQSLYRPSNLVPVSRCMETPNNFNMFEYFSFFNLNWCISFVTSQRMLALDENWKLKWVDLFARQLNSWYGSTSRGSVQLAICLEIVRIAHTFRCAHVLIFISLG